MHGLMLLMASVALSSDPTNMECVDSQTMVVVAKDKDTVETHAQIYEMPFVLDRDRRLVVDRVVLYVSDDGGLTWKRHSDYKPGEHLSFEAPHDGIYWFAVQTVEKDGTTKPARRNLTVVRKVYFNTQSPDK